MQNNWYGDLNAHKYAAKVVGLIVGALMLGIGFAYLISWAVDNNLGGILMVLAASVWLSCLYRMAYGYRRDGNNDKTCY